MAKQRHIGYAAYCFGQRPGCVVGKPIGPIDVRFESQRLPREDRHSSSDEYNLHPSQQVLPAICRYPLQHPYPIQANAPTPFLDFRHHFSTSTISMVSRIHPKSILVSIPSHFKSQVLSYQMAPALSLTRTSSSSEQVSIALPYNSSILRYQLTEYQLKMPLSQSRPLNAKTQDYTPPPINPLPPSHPQPTLITKQ